MDAEAAVQYRGQVGPGAVQGRAEDGSDPAGAGSRLVEGAGAKGWKQALQQLAMAYPERTEPYVRKV